MSESSSPSGPSNAGDVTWVAASGRAPARPDAGRESGRRRRARALPSSARLVGEPQQLARDSGRAARPGGGSARRSAASSPRPRPARQTSPRGSRSRRARAPARHDCRRAARPSARSAGRGRTRSAAGRRCRPCRQSWRSPATSTSGSVTPSARSVATTSSPWRRSATCIESNSASCGRRQPGREPVSLARRHARRRTCARNWRSLVSPPGCGRRHC